jgi:hypothetical protein
MHPALEQDKDQCNRHNPLINLDRQRTEAMKHVGCDSGKDQEDPRRRHPHPFADPVGQHRAQQGEGGKAQDHTERHNVIHVGAQSQRSTATSCCIRGNEIATQ